MFLPKSDKNNPILTAGLVTTQNIFIEKKSN